ncbi:tryptophan 7-halogenase [Alteromonas sediminis]|uniref:Tryptophan 7-halogenase n=1 Tax=Alteromonas sediminis TaxID=2259342 RepID=A0A3N5Y2M9_9ALTE|nr:tryptophan halogenase family protein [Alteromonas sediminis]RPJ68012.1 tryptophan 7-halogenase [Alteromonas sediminis]
MNVSPSSKQHSILIVGGGTAGWIAANLIACKLPDFDVTVIESDDIGIIGVGEGSTPHLKLFFETIGIADHEWMPQCNATYKNGITFSGWSHKPGYDSYFHPFETQVDDPFTVPLFFKNIQARMQGFDVDARPDRYFLESFLSQHHLGPLPDDSFPFGVAFGYHFDSGLLGKFLTETAKKRGVKRVEGKISHVLTSASGAIHQVVLENGESITADMFIDCSGFRSLLLQDTLHVEFKSFKENLFNDAAVVLATPISSPLPVETKATALSNGWAWKIPLQNRFGNGYVYSSDYINSTQAEHELRAHLGMLDSDTEARHLSMKVGRVEKHWHKNCVAVGLSQGFIEPLEATAIALSLNTVLQFINCYQEGGFTNQYEDVFNQDINKRFDGIRDYVVCHYKANQRSDTEYWRDNAANPHISERLKAILHLWQNSGNFAAEMYQRNLYGSYNPKSWACLLAGYGVFPNQPLRQVPDPKSYQLELDNVADFLRRCGLNFKPHSALL